MLCVDSIDILRNTYLKERLVICNDEDTDGQARVTMDEDVGSTCRLNRTCKLPRMNITMWYVTQCQAWKADEYSAVMTTFTTTVKTHDFCTIPIWNACPILGYKSVADWAGAVDYGWKQASAVCVTSVYRGQSYEVLAAVYSLQSV